MAIQVFGVEVNIRYYALLASLIAGLATTLGSLVVWWFDNDVRPRHLAFVLGLAASVMITVSMIDLLPHSYYEFGLLLTTFYFGVGVAIFILLQKCMPQEDSSMMRMIFPTQETEERSIEDPSPLLGVTCSPSASQKKALDKKSKFRLAMVMLLTLTLHNFPEGCAVAVTSLDDENLGLITTIAIALHNIPEGLAISVPIYDSTGRRDLAVFYTLLSGLSEPLGAFVTIFFIVPVFGANKMLLHIIECIVAGIMTAVSFLELLPEARKQGRPRAQNVGIVAGIAVMVACNYYV